MADADNLVVPDNSTPRLGPLPDPAVRETSRLPALLDAVERLLQSLPSDRAIRPSAEGPHLPILQELRDMNGMRFLARFLCGKGEYTLGCAEDRCAHSAPDSGWDDQDLWENMSVSLHASAQAALAQLIRGASETPSHSPGSSGFPQSAVVHLDTLLCVNRTAITRTCRGRLDLPGRSLPVSVILLDWSDAQEFFSGEAHWTSSLRHPNILPVLGLGACIRLSVVSMVDCVAVIVPYLVDTDLRTYLRTHPDADKRRLIIQLAEALEYLHCQQGLIYGGLEPRSVRVNYSGEVVLDISPLIDTNFQYAFKDARFGSGMHDRHASPYAAPEIVLAEGRNASAKTRESDMYAFGMLVYEILSGREPWADATLVDIFRYIVSARQLPRPEDGTIDDSLWNLCTACWSQNPADRPGIANVLTGLRSDAPRTRWGPDTVVGLHRWHPSEPLLLEEHVTDPFPTEMEVEIRGSLVRILIRKQKPIAGAFGTVMRGYTYTKGIVRVYALKACRGNKIMPREYGIWKSLAHRNILPLLGVVDTNVSGSRQRIFVSPYQHKGDLAKYLKSTQPGNRRLLRLMTDVATGLQYLHDVKAIVHGDIKAENILISRLGIAVLADFGLSTYVAPSRQETVYEVRQVYTLTYGAPEILDDTAEDPSAPGVIRSKTKMSDMFAYGVLLYHTYTNGLGRSQRDRIQLMVDMYDGRFPPRPVGGKVMLCDELWSICTRCWAKAPLQRPLVAIVLEELKHLWAPPSRCRLFD